MKDINQHHLIYCTSINPVSYTHLDVYKRQPLDVTIKIFDIADCKQLFHTKCIQNGGVLQLPCLAQHSPGSGASRKKHRKHTRTPYTPQAPHFSQFSLTGISDFTDRTDKIISDVRELQLMQDFITKKV